MLLKAITLCALFPVVFSTLGVSLSEMFPYGSTANDQSQNIHNQFSQAVLLDFYAPVTIPNTLPSFKIYGVDLGRNTFINYNGHITFGARHGSFDPSTVTNLESGVTAMFNVFYSDNDLRRPNGQLYYRLSQQISDLNKANNLIRGRGFTTFTASYCLIATWEKVRFYVADENNRAKPETQMENTYQEILCTDGNDGHVIYQYQDMQWTKSEDPTTKAATVGWIVVAATGDLRQWTPATSGQANAFSEMATGSNVGFAGRWMRSQVILGPCVGQLNGMYQINCTHYRECCGQKVQRETACPSGSTFHPVLKYCVESKVYTCGATHFCASRADGNYANIATVRTDDFWRCRRGIGRILSCPHQNVFGTSRCLAAL